MDNKPKPGSWEDYSNDCDEKFGKWTPVGLLMKLVTWVLFKFWRK